MFIVVGALFIVGITLVLFRLNQSQTTDETAAPTAAQLAARDDKVAQIKREGVIHNKALAAIKDGDIAKANDIYASEIASEPDTVRKIQLYISQSQLLYDTGNANKAIKVALQAESVSTDKYLAADWLARMYADQKQYANAARYYTLAGKWAASPTNEALLSKAYYDSQATHAAAMEKK